MAVGVVGGIFEDVSSRFHTTLGTARVPLRISVCPHTRPDREPHRRRRRPNERFRGEHAPCSPTLTRNSAFRVPLVASALQFQRQKDRSLAVIVSIVLGSIGTFASP